MRKGSIKLREWWRFYQRKELNSLKSTGVTLNTLMSHRSCSISWWIQIFSRIFVMSQFRDANYAKVFQCQHWPVYLMKMQIWFGSRLFWTTKAHFSTKMRTLHPKSLREEKVYIQETQHPWLRATQKNSWPNNPASNLILKFCKFLMLQHFTQVWKLFKLLSVFRIILKHMNMFKWRDNRRLQMTELLPDFKMRILSSKSRSEEATKS